jgi:O-antigen/teichoic acid export membrane protein
VSTAQRVIKNTGFLYAKMGITMFISLYTTRLILNTLGASDFGIFNIVGGAIAMLGFLNAAMASATQRFMSYSEGEGNKEKQKSIFNVSVVLHLGIALAVGIVLLVAGWFFFNGILNIAPDRISAAKVVYGSLIVSTMFTVMTVPYDAVLNAHENMLYYSIVGIVESLLKLATALVVVRAAGDKLVVYGILMACIPLITMTVMRLYCHKHYVECVIAPKRFWDKGLMKEMTSFAKWNLLGSMSSMFSFFGTGVVINYFFGTIANASQGISNQVSGQLGVLGTSIMKSINPIISKSAGAKNYNLMIKSTIYGTKIIFFVVGILFLPFLIEMPYILKLWLKTPPHEVEFFCTFLLLTNLLDQLVLFLPQAISAMGNIRKYQKVMSLLYILPLPIAAYAYYLGAPAYAMYIITASVSVIKCFCVTAFAHELCGIPFWKYLTNVVVRCLLSFGAAFALIYFLSTLMQQGIMRLIVVVFSSVVLYGFLAFFIGLSREERSYVKLRINQLVATLINKSMRICR